ncbi:GTP binding protein [Phlyctochytrium bullatum]|nr:GTP binding protein [Phlyctochytrium bullatum]
MDLGANTSYDSSFMVENVKGNALPQEVEEGNVEYKLKLVNPPPERVEHLITQMKWRLAEGHGEAMYEIGVADNGQLIGLNPRDLEASLATLRLMGSRLSADVSIIRVRDVTPSSTKDTKDSERELRYVAEVLVRKCLTDDQHFLEIRVAILGGADAGKSTLVGVLAHSEFDNGRGKSRLNLLRHRHEIETGRTSSISHQIIGFNPRGDLINYGSTNVATWEQVCELASKVVTFLDTCGHPKYQRTTISGISGHSPDYACLILSASAGGISEVPREHLGIAVGLTVPVFVVITKIDVATQEQLTGTVSSLLSLLRSPGVRRVPKVIQNEDDLVSAASSLLSSRVIPVFLTSSVTGENMELLIKFLNLLPKPAQDGDDDRRNSEDVEFAIEEVYTPLVKYWEAFFNPDKSPSDLPLSRRILPFTILAQIVDDSFPSGSHLCNDKDARASHSPGTGKRAQKVPIRNGWVGGDSEGADNPRMMRGEDFSDEMREFLDDDEDDEDYSILETTLPPPWFRVRKGQVVLSKAPWMKRETDESVTATDRNSQKNSGTFLEPPNSPTWTPSIEPDAADTAATSQSSPVADPSVSTAVKFFTQSIDSKPGTTAAAWEFEADIHVLHATVPVGVGSQGVAYCGAVGQGCRIMGIRDEEGKWACLSSPPGPSASFSSMYGGALASSPAGSPSLLPATLALSPGSPSLSHKKKGSMDSPRFTPSSPNPSANFVASLQSLATASGASASGLAKALAIPVHIGASDTPRALIDINNRKAFSASPRATSSSHKPSQPVSIPHGRQEIRSEASSPNGTRGNHGVTSATSSTSIGSGDDDLFKGEFMMLSTGSDCERNSDAPFSADDDCDQSPSQTAGAPERESRGARRRRKRQEAAHQSSASSDQNDVSTRQVKVKEESPSKTSPKRKEKPESPTRRGMKKDYRQAGGKRSQKVIVFGEDDEDNSDEDGVALSEPRGPISSFEKAPATGNPSTPTIPTPRPDSSGLLKSSPQAFQSPSRIEFAVASNEDCDDDDVEGLWGPSEADKKGLEFTRRRHLEREAAKRAGAAGGKGKQSSSTASKGAKDFLPSPSRVDTPTELTSPNQKNFEANLKAPKTRRGRRRRKNREDCEARETCGGTSQPNHTSHDEARDELEPVVMQDDDDDEEGLWGPSPAEKCGLNLTQQRQRDNKQRKMAIHTPEPKSNPSRLPLRRFPFGNEEEEDDSESDGGLWGLSEREKKGLSRNQQRRKKGPESGSAKHGRSDRMQNGRATEPATLTSSAASSTTVLEATPTSPLPASRSPVPVPGKRSGEARSHASSAARIIPGSKRSSSKDTEWTHSSLPKGSSWMADADLANTASTALDPSSDVEISMSPLTLAPSAFLQRPEVSGGQRDPLSLSFSAADEDSSLEHLHRNQARAAPSASSKRFQSLRAANPQVLPREVSDSSSSPVLNPTAALQTAAPSTPQRTDPTSGQIVGTPSPINTSSPRSPVISPAWRKRSRAPSVIFGFGGDFAKPTTLVVHSTSSSLAPPPPPSTPSLAPVASGSQTANTLPVAGPVALLTGTRARVRLRFEYEPEWLRVGSPILLRGEERIKCVGRVAGIVVSP